MVSFKLAECARLPLEPCTVKPNVPTAAEGAAPKTTDWFPPAVTLNGLAGFDVTPAGTPAKLICTLPLKPFVPVTEMVTGALVAP
jgi:hypothetical protein